MKTTKSIKTPIMKKLLPKIIILLTLTFVFTQCDNDNGNSPNQNQCNYAGLTFLDPNNNTQTLIPESDLTTDFFPNNNGPGNPGVEVYKTSNAGSVWFITNVVTLNATGIGTLGINGNTYNVTVTCQRAGTAVGDEFRFDIVLSTGEESELCVVIDNVTP